MYFKNGKVNKLFSELTMQKTKLNMLMTETKNIVSS